VTALSNVAIKVEQSLPGVTSRQAQDAWMSFQWKGGGGLPVLISHEEDEQTRRLFPIGMEETLLEQKDNEIRYQVTDMGLFSSELGSHSARVLFLGTRDGTNMIWNVEFEAAHRENLWKAITEVNIRAVSANLASYVAIPRLYRRTTIFPAKYNDNLPQQWVDFVWRRGGGLPLPPPVRLNDEKRLIVPPFLVERLAHVKKDEIWYTVDNPGLLTYQVHTHAARVQFRQHYSGKMEMVWQVEARPLVGWSFIVELFTSTVITTLARNFKVHVTEPGSTVKLAPPRGKGESFGQVPKETWLGGVLAAHLSDQRSTAEQAIALFQPWTWGRSTDDNGEGEEWTTGYM
jgi:hypothetical protein